MKKLILIILLIAISFLLGYFFNTIVTDISEKKQIVHQTDSSAVKKEQIDKKGSERVTGIGGIFFKCKDPDNLKEWYKIHLGLNTDQYGARFEWQVGCDSSKMGSIQWSLFSEDEPYFAPSLKEFMINYEVADLPGLVEQLKKEGVTIIDSIATYDYGKFIHIMDPEGNKIELWEPDYSYGN